MEELHPTVAAFKEFINNHPALIREIRKSGASWQEYYEKWVLLGEDDPLWEKYKMDQKKEEENKDSEMLNQILKYASKVDVNKMQGQINQLSKAITSIQALIEQFRQTQKDNQPNSKDPFSWMRD